MRKKEKKVGIQSFGSFAFMAFVVDKNRQTVAVDVMLVIAERRSVSRPSDTTLATTRLFSGLLVRTD